MKLFFVIITYSTDKTYKEKSIDIRRLVAVFILVKFSISAVSHFKRKCEADWPVICTINA